MAPGWTLMIYCRRFQDVWYAMVPEKLTSKSPPLSVCFAREPVKTLWAPGFPALFAVAKERTIALVPQFAICATEPENGMTDYPAHAAKE